jgi:hypothetical protein
MSNPWEQLPATGRSSTRGNNHDPKMCFNSQSIQNTTTGETIEIRQQSRHNTHPFFFGSLQLRQGVFITRTF